MLLVCKFQLDILKIKNFLIYTYVSHWALFRAPVCTSGKYTGWCPSHYATLHNWTRHIFFLLKAIAVKFKIPINIWNAFKCSKCWVCSLKDEGYTEWRTGPRFQHQTASMGRYETTAIFLFYFFFSFSDIESNWKLLLLLGTTHAISM